MNDVGSMVKAVNAMQFSGNLEMETGETKTQCIMNWDPKSRCSPVC